MDKIFSEPNEENDCTEHVRKKRLSSILKVPRSPLQDLGSGNEFTQDYHAEKRRKSSRRVSFADTINFRVFKTDVKVNMAEPGNAETATDVRNQVLLNHSVQRPGQSPVGQNGYLDYVNEGSETAQCEITGMDTLLHAPIQTSVQQTEQCNVDHTSEEMNRHDRTLIFSDENEMDMTASCTAVIMRSNLKRNQETDQPRKIDFTSFMAELASRSEEMAKEFRFFSDPTNDACSSLQQKPDNTVKKINFNEFLMSVKSSEEVANPTFAMPDKKNLFFVSPQVLEGNVFSPMEDAYNYAQERTCNVTKIFRGQDDGMDVTKCHSSDMKTFFPATCEASSKQLGHEDITVAFRNDGMDMTASHTVKLSFTRNGPSNTENQNQNISMDFSSNFVSGNSRLEGPPNYQFGVQKGPQTCVGTKTVNAKDEVDFTRSHTICVDEHEVTQISKQGARAMVMMPGSVSSGAVFLDNKTIFSTCNDMDVTGKCTEVICKETCRETCGSYAASQKPENATPLLMENTISGQNDDMDIKKRHITLDNQVLGQCKIREPVISSVLENRSKMAIQNHRTVALYVGVNSHANSSFWPSKCGFQDNLANSHIVSGEEMDLTKSYIANGIEKSIENEFPSDISTSITNKPQSFGSIPTACNLNEQEEMEITKRHAVVTGNQTTRITAGLEQMQPKITCESWKKTISEAVSPLDSNKENLLLVRGNNINVEIIHTLGTNVRDLKGQVDFEKAGEKNAYVGGLHSITKNIFSLQEPDKEVPQRQTTATNRHAQTNFQKQASEISQPLNKSIFDHSLAFANDERGIFSDDQDMDITRNHTVALAFASTSGQQKCETTHSQNNTVSKTQQLQNNTLLFSGDFSTDITRSQTVAVACGNFKMSSKQEHPMAGSDQTPEPVAPSVSFISSNETVPCGIKGYMQCGKTAGIYLSDKESELQGQSHTMEPLSEGMPDIANSEKLLSTSKRVSSEEDVSKSHIAANNDMYLRCAEESLLTRTSRPYSKNPQLSPCPEKSVVFSSKENMDPTGSYSLNVQANSPDKVLKEEKVLAKYVNRVEDNILFPKEKDVITTDSLRPMISDKNMLNLTDLKPMSLLNEKTVQFSEDNDMEITKNHTVAADKMYAQKKSSNRALLCFPADKTCVFTCSDDMEITTLNTVVTDKPVEMAASQVVPKPDKGAGRKSQIGSTGEKTTLFSYGVETDMEVTESCTAAIDHQISSKSQRAPCEPTLRHVDKSHVSMCNDDMEITALNTVVIDKPIEKAASQVVPKVGKEAGRKSQIELTGEKTRLFSFGIENDMEITESCTAAIDRQISSKGQKMPCEPTLHYVDRTHVSTCNDDMEITALNTVIIDRPIEKAASQVMPKVGKGAGRKSQIELTGEKTRLFSFGVENDMEVTESCTAAIDHQISSKSQRAPCEPTLRHVDKSHVSMCNDDMEITALNTVVIDRPIEKAASQVVPKVGKGAGRKSQIELTGEKTRLFSFGVENDMEITESCTAAINRQISSKGQKMPCEPTLHYVDKTHVFTCNDDMEITALNTGIIDKPIEKAASQVVPKVGKEAGRKSQMGLTGEKTRLFSFGVENDMEITESCTAAIDRQISSKDQEPPLLHLDKNIEFAFNQDDMQITESRAVPRIVQRVMSKDQLKLDAQVGQEALSNNKTVIFPMGENMEIIKIPEVAVDYNEIALQGGQPNQTVPIAPVDKTIVFTGNQVNMEITASHTTAVNNTLKGYENQDVSDEGGQQQSLHRKPSSTCREKIYSKHTGDFRSDCQLELKDKYGTNFPVSSETNIIKIHNGATEEFIHPEDALDIIQKPQNCTDFPKANSTSVYSEDLVKLVRPKDTKRVSFKLLENQLETSKVESENEVTKNSPVVCSEENGDAVLHVQSPVQQPHLHKDTSECLRKNAHSVPNIDSKNDSGKLTSSKQECRLTDLVTDGADAVTISYKEMEENEKMPFEKKTLPKDFQTTSEQTEQLSLVTVVPTDQIDPNCVPALSGIVNVCSRLKHIRRKSEFATISEIDPVSNFAEQLPKLATQPGDSFRVGKDTESKSSNAVRIQEPANVYFESGGASVDTLLDTVHKGACQGRKIRLGIFLPKLPNNRNCNTSNAQDLNKKAEGKEKTAVPEVNLVTRETPENTCLKHNLSPSQFIAEELLPVFPEEMDSNDSLSCDPPDGALSVMDKKEIFPNKRNSHEEQEICSNQKRAIEQEETELQNGKKLKRGDGWDDSAPNQQQPTCNTSHTQAETPECKEPPNLSTKSPDRTHSSSSSSLDSIKADADFSSMQPNSQMESQLLTDSICEQNLLEKFQDGLITVGEFFTLLQVHIVIQKPRQSHLPANYAMNPTSTPEDQFFSQYIYRPKLKIYEEDCQLLSQMINELKLRASDQDKLLVDVNRSLWEVMRTCSDEELKNFGAELNKMKSYFTKKSKVLAHNGKVQLYGKLLQDIQVQWENLHSRMAKVDEFLKEVDNCRLALETSTNLEDYGTENDDQLSEWKSRIRNSENELVDLKAQEEVLQRDLSNLEAEKQQVLAEIKHLKKKTNDCQELLERYNFTEWEISEWSDHQAVFTFLYDSIELTLRFGPPIDGALFNEKPCKKIVDVSFESLLDEERAPLSSRLVKRLIFQFIESQKSWQEKCPTLNHVPQMLREVSLVVCRCRLLGEEIEFLMKWGGKFNLLKTEVDDTKVKLLFSTSTAFAKFEVMLSLSATYPSAPLPFTVQKLIGNLSQDEISAVVSSVPLGTNYLRRMVKLIHHKLFT